MARKSKEETEKTRISLLDAALRVFSTKGYVRSTLNDIAKEAGVSRGAIYWHFEDKVDLFEALSNYIDQCNCSTTQALLEESFSSLEDIEEKVLSWISKLETDEKFRTFYEFINFKVEFHEELDSVLAKERELKRAFLKRFEMDYENLQKKGQVRTNITPRQAALMTLFFTSGLVEKWLFDHELFSLSQDAPGMIREFLKGLASPSQQG